MAARPTWKGYLKISLVNIPVRVFPATDAAATISFNQLHAECQSRIQQKRWCPRCEREVPNAEIVKGYEFEKGRYVVLDDDDLAKVRPESTRVINLVQFAECAASSTPSISSGRTTWRPTATWRPSAFAVIRDGMAGKVGIGKLALYGRDTGGRAAAGQRARDVHPAAGERGPRHGRDRRSSTACPTRSSRRRPSSPGRSSSTFESAARPARYKDEYQAELRRVIDAKVAGQEVTAPAEEAPNRVVDLMEALRRSLDAVSAGKKTQARASLPRAKPGSRASRRPARRTKWPTPARRASQGRPQAQGVLTPRTRGGRARAAAGRACTASARVARTRRRAGRPRSWISLRALRRPPRTCGTHVLAPDGLGEAPPAP